MRLVAILLVAGLALSGCTLPFIGGDGIDGTFTRAVVFQIDSSTMAGLEHVERPDEVLQAMASTQYTYTHNGDTVDTAGLTVRFTGEDGGTKAVPLSDYTTQSKLSRGDSVVIDGLLMTSGISIGDGDEAATREGVRTEWLHALGYPLPLAARPGDAASWAYDVRFDLGAGVERIDQEGQGMRDATLDTKVDMAGTFGFATRPAGDGMDMDVRLVLAGLLDLLAEATVVAEEDVPMGADIDANAEVDGLLALGFGPLGLETAAISGTARSDGTVHIWDDEHARSEHWEPDGIQHPFIDESLPEMPIPVAAGVDVLEAVVLFLDDLYAMDLAPGDSFTMHTDIDAFVARFQSTYEVRVTSAEEKVVAAGTFDTLRLQSTQEITVHLGTQRLSLPLAKSTVWLERETYLPVAVESRMSVTLDEDDLLPLTRVASATGMSVDGAYLRLGLTADMELQQHDGTPRVAGALLGAGNALMMPMMAPLAAFGGVPPPTFEPGMPPAPEYGFVHDEGMDRVVLQSAEHGRVWEELFVETSGPAHVAFDRPATIEDPDAAWGAPIEGGEMQIGHFLSFCAEEPAQDIDVWIRFLPSHRADVVFEATFAELAACA